MRCLESCCKWPRYCLPSPCQPDEASLMCRSTADNNELQRWRSARPCIAGFITRELSCQDGMYSAEMEPIQLQ